MVFVDQKNLQKSKLKNTKRQKEKFYKKYKNVYVRNNVMSTVIKRCRSKKKEAKDKYMDLEKN